MSILYLARAGLKTRPYRLLRRKLLAMTFFGGKAEGRGNLSVGAYLQVRPWRRAGLKTRPYRLIRPQ